MQRIKDKLLAKTVKGVVAKELDGGEQEYSFDDEGVPRKDGYISDNTGHTTDTSKKGSSISKLKKAFRWKKNGKRDPKKAGRTKDGRISDDEDSDDDGATTGGETVDGDGNSSDEERVLHRQRRREERARFGANAKGFENTDKQHMYHVVVRIIEGRDIVSGGALRVRALIDGVNKSTRTSSEAQPRWRQNLSFTCNTSLEKLAKTLLTIKVYSVRRLINDNVIGEFDTYLGSILHQPDRAIISRWIAMRSPNDDEEAGDAENCGFLKVSIAVYGNNESPPPFNDNDDTEELFSGAQMSEYTLRIRLFSLRHIIDEIIHPENKKTTTKYFIQVLFGDKKEDSSIEELISSDSADPRIDFDQEVCIPILWPTVISKIYFLFIVQTGKKLAKRRIVGQASLLLRDLYEPGQKGFLPTYGPGYINFYGHELIPRLKTKRVERNLIDDGVGSKYSGRLMVQVDCVDFMDDAKRGSLPFAALAYVKQFDRVHEHTLYTTFFCCNYINPLYASANISFHVSMGNQGSLDVTHHYPRSSTLATMPDHDRCKYFSIGWGNHKPIAEVLCQWESVSFRMQRINAVLKAVTLLDQLVDTGRTLGEIAAGEVCSLAVDGIEIVCDMLLPLLEHHKPHSLITNLDHLQFEQAVTHLKNVRQSLINLKYEPFTLAELGEQVLRQLARTSDHIRRLASDAGCSLPDVLVKMCADGKIVGYARVAAHEILYHQSASLQGEFCGRIRAIRLEWPNGVRNRKATEVPAYLHVKMFLARRDLVKNWDELILPAQTKRFIEVFHNQYKPTLRDWVDASDVPAYSDESGTVNRVNCTRDAPAGWEYLGNWSVRNTHDLWITDGVKKHVDMVFELQEKTDGGWHACEFTGFHGGRISKEQMERPRDSGWKYVDDWKVDLHLRGDREGWVYAASRVFWGHAGTTDVRETAAHRFRRRCLRRTRRLIDSPAGIAELLEYEKSLGDTRWEYTVSRNRAFHSERFSEDTVRRRRLVMEVARTEPLRLDNIDAARVYEVHDSSSLWELRCYILWAKDLLPVTKLGSRAYVRATFMERSSQTLLVDSSQNPVWNETLLIDQLLIPGGQYAISAHPPSVLVQINGEKHDDSEVFLGEFSVRPTVITSHQLDKRGQPRWHTLHFTKGKTRGAVLALFELFQRDSENKPPMLPAKKASNNKAVTRYEVPTELRPKFEHYSVQVLCWGVRKLAKYQFLSVRKPFVELIIGDMEGRTDPLEDTRTNPNFAEPLITFPDVQLPSALHLAPPLTLNLYTCRAFQRTPLLGVCLITNFHKYIRTNVAKADKKMEYDWKTFDEIFHAEERQTDEDNSGSYIPLRNLDVRLDWWSKYYFSIGEPKRAPGFAESGIEKLTVFKWALEETKEYGRFEDFLDTFKFRQSSRGMYDDTEEKEVTGEMKGKLFIMKHVAGEQNIVYNPPGVEFTGGPVKCLLRVYIVGATGLISHRRSGIVDPYVIVRCGKQKVNLKKNYRGDTVDPEFGEVVEMSVTIPIEKDLKISIMDRRRLIADEEIGSTTIDLENRLMTKHRGTVGLARQYTIKGDLVWRDQLTPLAILKRYCRKMLLPAPEFITKPDDVGIKMLGVEFWLSAIEPREEEPKLVDAAEPERPAAGSDKPVSARDDIVGRPFQRIALHILHQVALVPEHVESRPLLNPVTGRAEQGKLQLFVDLFPLSIGSVPPALDISVRKPEKYQLRVAIFGVQNAIMTKRSFGKPCADLYLKVFINGMQGQTTDIHYRVLDGVASFNWRFLIDFDYNPWEKLIYSYGRKRLFRKVSEQLVEPLLIVQLWDNNKFKKDAMLGEIVLNLLSFQEGIMDEDDVEEVKYASTKKKCCCVRCCSFLCETRCCRRKRKKTNVPLPRAPQYVPEDVDEPAVSIFDSPNASGWWPVLTTTLPEEQKQLREMRSKKFDADVSGARRRPPPAAHRHDPTAPSAEVVCHQPGDEERAEGGGGDDPAVPDVEEFIMGMVEMEIGLVSLEDAHRDPVGKKREKPNHSPFLPKPHRSRWNALWFLSRLRPALAFCWSNCGMQVLFVCICVLLTVMIVWAVIEATPMIIANTIAG